MDRNNGGNVERFRALLAQTEAVLTRRPVWLAVIVLVLALQGALVWVHRPWLDEWQALLIALLSPDLGSLLDNLHYEAHPPLWYLLLRGVGWVVPPMAVLAATQWLVASATQYVILTRVPLPRLYRLLFALGYFTLIEFGSLSRSLGLGALLLLVFAFAGTRWLRWAAIILLPMVDFQFGLLSMIAVALLWRDGDRSPAGIALWVVSGLLATWSVLPAPDMVPAMPIRSWSLGFVQTISTLSALLVPFHFWPGQIGWSQYVPMPYGIVLGVLFILLADRWLRPDTFHRLLFHGFLWACLLFSTFIYPFAVRHMTLVAWLLIILIALQHRAGKPYAKSFALWLGVGAAMGLWGSVVAFTTPFSSAYRVAEIIRERGLEDEMLVSWPAPMAIPVAVELRRELPNLEKECTQAFHRWDKPEIGLDAQKVGAAVTRFGEKHGRYIIISPLDMEPVYPYAKMRRIAYVPAGFDGYEYYLYSVAYDRQPTGTPLPRCKPERLNIEDWR